MPGWDDAKPAYLCLAWLVSRIIASKILTSLSLP